VEVDERARVFVAELASVEEDPREPQSVADVRAAAAPPEQPRRRRGTPRRARDDASAGVAGERRAGGNGVVVGLGAVAAAADELSAAARLRHGVRHSRRPHRVRVRNLTRTGACHSIAPLG